MKYNSRVPVYVNLLFVGDSDTWGAELEGLEGDHAKKERVYDSQTLLQKTLERLITISLRVGHVMTGL